MEKEIIVDIPTFQELCEPLLGETLSQPTAQRLYDAYSREILTMLEYAQKATKPLIKLTLFGKEGSQHIAEFWVNDLDLPVEDKFNWHLQNTSQWKYAGAIVIQGGEVSTHH